MSVAPALTYNAIDGRAQKAHLGEVKHSTKARSWLETEPGI
eukprot:CAMPEP_0119342172 /NCGR_PEP_ID=MMETSP1333-20130426/104161_1 /TAXON_ID=418940 /ORGANISM="Scyphosphaera apsteinii, Strain RCC1455" /LENGTH=40 /DNA_ID= /DNA_START= /DNA_END= /DNA_ORIENTATION=